MEILFIHFSDIHIREKNNLILERINKIPNVLQDFKISTNIVFLLISGDITYSGKKEEYIIASELLNDFIKKLKKLFNLNIKCIMIPGNHDCNFEVKQDIDVRNTLIKKCREDGFKNIDNENSGIISFCCKVQNNFNNFYNKYIDKDKLLNDFKLLKIYKYSFNNYNILFNCFNTAWISSIDEKPGELYFPTELYTDLFNNIRNIDFSISILHHPIHWQSENSRRKLLKLVEDHSDLIITSHEHIQGEFAKDYFNEGVTEYLEGGILQDIEDKNISNFNVLSIDFKNDEREIKSYEIKWNKDIYEKHIKSKRIRSSIEKKLIRGHFNIKQEFRDFLYDIGATFTHPKKEKISLQDIFIFPEFRNLKFYESKKEDIYESIKPSEEIFNHENEENKYIIIGDEKAGKTSLCKKLFLNYIEKKFIPIYIDGRKIRRKDIKSFNELLNKLFKEEYLNDDNINYFMQTSYDKRFLIIDDFDKCRLNLKSRMSLLGEICKFYENIVITASNYFQFEDILYSKSDSNLLFDYFEQYEIMEFCPSLRVKLIDKWNKLGREDEVDDKCLLRMRDNSEKIVDTIIGKNYVPTYPLFLLTILQSIEIGKPHDLAYSTYGHYYHFLITSSLTKIPLRHDRYDPYFSYLTEFANYIFEQKGTKKISKENLIIFHNKFCKDYRVNLDFDKIISHLTAASLINESKDGLYDFTYKYIYYFFAAKYLADNITHKKVKDRISKMCDNLFIEEYANLVIFLIHHSKDPSILDKIRKKALEIFKEVTPIEFEEDIKFINEFITDIPALVLEDRDVKKVREEILKKRDRAEILIKEKERKGLNKKLNKDIEETKFLSLINLSMKLLKILGQTLQNYWGSLKGYKKYTLTKEAYCLGLRTLHIFLFVFLYNLADNYDYLKEKVGRIIKKKYKKPSVARKEIEKITQGYIFNFCCFVSFLFIKAISNSLGNENLIETFKEVLNKNKYNSIYLIDISIKLDFFKSSPLDDIKYLKNRLKNNFLPYFILKKLVINYLYISPLDYNLKQQICNMLDIPIRQQRYIQRYLK